MDAIAVLMNIAAGRGNVLLYWITGMDNIMLILALIMLFDVTYIIVRFKGLSRIRNCRSLMPVFFLWALLLYNLLNTSLQKGKLNSSYLELVIIAVLFLLILNQQYIKTLRLKMPYRDSFKYMSHGYLWIAFISVFGVISSFLLFKLGLVSEVPFSLGFFETNENVGVQYSRVFLSVRNFWISSLGQMDIRVPFFQDDGLFCGLFHEPHILALNVFPFFIILLGIVQPVRLKIIVISFSVLMMLFTGSATNALVAIFCLAFYFFLLSRKHLFVSLFGVLIIVGMILLFVAIDDTFLLFVIDRLDGSNSSYMSTRELFTFAFTPQTLFGTDFFSTNFTTEAGGSLKGQDIGYIAFFLFLCFLISYFKNVIKLCRSNDDIAIAVGFASLYYILHSLKGGMPMFQQFLFVFLIFLQSFVLSHLCHYGRIKSANKA